jgi:hypothetical protein
MRVMVPPPSLMPLVQGRHHEVAVANFADGHSRPLRTRHTSMTVSRADGGTAYLYCLLEVGPVLFGRRAVRGDALRAGEPATRRQLVQALSWASAREPMVHPKQLR